MNKPDDFLRIEILPIGREILTGRIQETNAGWIAKQVATLGHMVMRITVLDDDQKAIVDQLLAAINRNTNFLITTGGLGPTFDDITLEALAKGAGLSLKLHKDAAEFVEKKYQEYFQQGHVQFPELTPERIKMAMLPAGSQMIDNPVGAAPGALFDFDGMIIIALPGPPRELQPMFTQSVLPLLEKAIGDRTFLERTVHTPCTDESSITALCKELSECHEGLHVKTNPTYFGDKQGLKITLSIWGENAKNCDLVLTKAAKMLEEKLEALLK